MNTWNSTWHLLTLCLTFLWRQFYDSIWKCRSCRACAITDDTTWKGIGTSVTLQMTVHCHGVEWLLGICDRNGNLYWKGVRPLLCSWMNVVNQYFVTVRNINKRIWYRDCYDWNSVEPLNVWRRIGAYVNNLSIFWHQIQIPREISVRMNGNMAMFWWVCTEVACKASSSGILSSWRLPYVPL